MLMRGPWDHSGEHPDLELEVWNFQPPPMTFQGQRLEMEFIHLSNDYISHTYMMKLV